MRQVRTIVTAPAALVLLGGALVVASPAEAAVTCDGHRATIVGTPGNDRLVGTSHRDVIAGLGGRDVVRAGDGDDVVCGGRGQDDVRGGTGSDVVRGQRGGDLLVGGRGDDVLDAGGVTRNGLTDTLEGGPGDDLLRSGDYFTIVTYLDARGGVLVDLARGFADGPGVGHDRLRGPRFVFGSPFDDDLRGSDRADVFLGFDGSDAIATGKGLDNLIGMAGADTLDAGAGLDFLAPDGRDVAHGGPGSDTFFPNGPSTSFGDGGQDFFEPVQGRPGFDGGAGRYDAVDLSAVEDPAVVDLAAGTASSGFFQATLAGTEWAFGSQAGDVLSGDAASNILVGGFGRDTLEGREGDDVLDGARGRDTLDGGDGTDQCSTEPVPRTSCETDLDQVRQQALLRQARASHQPARLAADHAPGTSDMRWAARWVARR